MLYLCTFLCLVLCRETRRLLERLVYVPTQDFPVTVVQVASWYLLRHLNAKNDQELMNVSIQPPHTCSNTRLNGFCDDILCTTHLKCLLPPVTHMETSNTYWNKLVILKTPLLVSSNSEHNLLFFQVLLQHAKMNGDDRLLKFHSLLASSSSWMLSTMQQYEIM